jgi:hypothetical protein
LLLLNLQPKPNSNKVSVGLYIPNNVRWGLSYFVLETLLEREIK